MPSLLFSFLPENRERVTWFSRIAKQCAEKLSVAFDDFQLRVQDDRDPVAHFRFSGQLLAHLRGVPPQNLLVVSRNNRFLAFEVVISRARCNLGRSCNLTHRGEFEALLTKQPQSFFKDQLLGFLASRLSSYLRLEMNGIEHVQIMHQASAPRQEKNEHVQRRL